MGDALKDCENELFGGYDAGELHLAANEDGDQVAQMFMMDAEYDPMRITFTCDDDVIFYTGKNKWLAFTPAQLRFIASQAKTGGSMTREAVEDE